MSRCFIYTKHYKILLLLYFIPYFGVFSTTFVDHSTTTKFLFIMLVCFHVFFFCCFFLWDVFSLFFPVINFIHNTKKKTYNIKNVDNALKSRNVCSVDFLKFITQKCNRNKKELCKEYFMRSL